MTLQPITYRGRTAAAATPQRVFLADELERRPAEDPEVVFVLYMAFCASDILGGQRIDGQPCLIDMPAGEHGRVHLVERGLTSNDELEAIVADYIDQSTRRGEPAIIARGGSELARQLGNPPE